MIPGIRHRALEVYYYYYYYYSDRIKYSIQNNEFNKFEPNTLQRQHVAVAIQRGNAACIIGTVPSSAGWDELFYI